MQAIHSRGTNSLLTTCKVTTGSPGTTTPVSSGSQRQGDMIILGMDLNDPAQRYDITKYFEGLNMKEAIQLMNRGQRPPATNIWNDSHYPIVGKGCSIGLTATRAGYCKFDVDISSDHRVLWVEFVLNDVFGSSDKTYNRFTQLKASDPRDVKKYIHRTKK